jgi:hypothetical protein
MSLEAIAVHEAGHAVITAMLGFTPRSAVITYNRDKSAAGLHSYGIPPKSTLDRRWGVLKIAIAGHMAEMLCGYAYPEPFVDWFARPRRCVYQNAWVNLSDQAQAWTQAKALSGAPDLFDEETYRGFIEAVESDVRVKLTTPAPWASLKMIADRLRTVGQVEQQEFYTIFEQANFDTRHLVPN